jgi:hypothetical protein
VRTKAASIMKLRSSLTFSFSAVALSRDAMGTENRATLFLKSLFGLASWIIIVVIVEKSGGIADAIRKVSEGVSCANKICQ